LTEDNRKTDNASAAKAPSTGRLSEMLDSAPAAGPPKRGAISRNGWIMIAVLGLLFVKLNWWQFEKLVLRWISDDNWTHGFIIPFFSLFLIYSWWGELISRPRRVFLPGLAVILFGLAVQIFGFVIFPNDWITSLSIPIVLWGLILYLAGPSVATLLFVPVFYLVFALPLPATVYEGIALPLQNFAAKMSGRILQLMGVQVRVMASRMEVISVSGERFPLTVEEACSGVRSLMAFLALGVALAYIEQRPFWQRAVIVVFGALMVIIVNVLRVTVTTLMFYWDKPELGQDFMHTLTGLVLLIPALILLMGLSWVLDKLYIEEEDDESPDGGENAPDGGDVPHSSPAASPGTERS
jgi:exosortase